jgi:Glycogen recognition site of AMP-activated protein kinase
MGNQPSKPPSRSTTQHEKDDRHERHAKEKERDREREREREKEREKEKEKKVNRRISIQALSHGKATAADPSASTESALAKTILQPPAQKPNLQQHLQHTTSQSPEPNDKPPAPIERSMSPARFNEQPQHDVQKEEKPALVSAPESAEPAIPMDVPVSTATRQPRPAREESTTSQGSPPSLTPQYTPMSAMLRPPRLPLAIADEVRSPDSPPLEPTRVENEEISIFDDDETALPRKSSMLSSTTMDDEDVGSELQPYAVDTGGVQVVPTRIEWKGSGEKVYVTGTFAHWDKKFRLHER